MRIAVTGGSGKAGPYIIADLVKHGHQVINVDMVSGGTEVPFQRADLTDYGQTVSVLQGTEALVHLAAIPNPRNDPPEVVFSTNVLSTWNVLQSAEVLGIGKLVLASSINAIGASFSKEIVPPQYLPVDEEHPTRAEDSYSLSKWVGEQIADGFARRRSVQIASFRFHGLLREDQMQELQRSPLANPDRNVGGFWGYVDLKDAARACRMALEAEWEGHETFFINASDTILAIPTEEAITNSYPGVPLKRPIPEYESAIDCSKARRFFGWNSNISWRDTGN